VTSTVRIVFGALLALLALPETIIVMIPIQGCRASG